MAKTIDGERFKQMICAAAAAVDERKEDINELNVFPVPDGDTGTNMALTLGNAAAELHKVENPTLGKAMEITSSALLRGARGNSGVITSLLFRGLTRSLKSAGSEFDGGALAAALTEGVQTAYKAVMKPAEGTILTVSRVSAEAAFKTAQKDRDPEKVLQSAITAAREALPMTMQQNPVLEKAQVVDAGAFGYIIILEGMMSALTGKVRSIAMNLQKPKTPSAAAASADFSQYDTEEITFAYCTEFIADREDKTRSVDKLRSFLSSIGDSLVVVEDDDLIKIHVHTDTPDLALGEGLKFGRLSRIKIENMQEQLERKQRDAVAQGLPRRRSAEPEKRYGFVAVAAGQGLASVFGDLGVDCVVEGGQTMNPSTEDILGAIDQTPAEVVFVLPNNKNIVMASEQAAALSEKQVIVLPTKTVPQGIAALLVFEPDRDPDLNREEMMTAVAAVQTGQITYAARDSSFDGRDIREGDFMAMLEGKLVANSQKFEDVMVRLARSMCSRKSQFITIFYGEGATPEQAETVREAFAKEAKNAEINVIDGGQPVYSYIISVE